MHFAFDFNANPALCLPELNAPRPCKHAANCFYNGEGGCAFVHPGEEGTGLQLFPARTVKDPETGKELWQKATVRLIGSAKFYERRRLKMSWPKWCALPKNAHLPMPGKMAQPPTQQQSSFFLLNPTEQFNSMFKSGYAIQTPEIIAAREAFMASFSPEATALNNKAIEEVKHQQMGNALYAIIAPFLVETENDMKEGGIWHKNITAGKITGMLLEAFSYEQLYPMLSNMEELKDKLAECCVIIKENADSQVAVA